MLEVRSRLPSTFRKIHTARKAEKFVGHRAEFEQNLGVRAEFRAEYAIFTSTAGRQNKPFYEQNLSKPTGVRYEVALARAGLATLEARRADVCCTFIESIQSGSPIAWLFSYNQAPTNTRDGLRIRASKNRVPYNTDCFRNFDCEISVLELSSSICHIYIVFMYLFKCLDNDHNLQFSTG